MTLSTTTAGYRRAQHLIAPSGPIIDRRQKKTGGLVPVSSPFLLGSILVMGVLAVSEARATAPTVADLESAVGTYPTFEDDIEPMMEMLGCSLCHMSKAPNWMSDFSGITAGDPIEPLEQAACGDGCHPADADSDERILPFRVARNAMQTDDYDSFLEGGYWAPGAYKGEDAYWRMALKQMPPAGVMTGLTVSMGAFEVTDGMLEVYRDWLNCGMPETSSDPCN